MDTFQVVDCHPKTLSLQQAARNGTSRRNVLSLYRKQHITASGLENSTLHEVTAFWGQHSHSLGVKLTPQLDQENVRVCECALTYCRACACECVCTHSCVSSMTHIPIFLLLRKLVDPGMCWYLEGVPLRAQLLWPKTKCHWLSNASHTSSVFHSLPRALSSLFNTFALIVDCCFGYSFIQQPSDVTTGQSEASMPQKVMKTRNSHIWRVVTSRYLEFLHDKQLEWYQSKHNWHFLTFASDWQTDLQLDHLVY